MISWLTGALDAAYRGLDTRHEITLRRLNRFEYRNTIRDLLQLNIESFDPTDSFPPDSEHEGFDNLADTLVTSDYLLERLLEAAAASVEKAVMFGPRPAPISLRFGPGDFGAFPRVERPMIAYYVNVGGRHLDLAHGDAKSFRAHAASFAGVPASGYYTLRIEAAGIFRKHPYDAELLEVDPEEPIKMEVLATDPAIGPPGYNQNASDRVLATIALRDDERVTYEVRVWLDRGFVPVIRYSNGPQPIKQVLARVAQKHHAAALPEHWRDGASPPITTNTAPGGKWLSDVYQGPRVRLFSMAIEGPQTRSWPPASHQAIFGPGEKSAEQVDVSTTLHRFASAAFRRPVSDAEARKFTDFVTERRQRGDSAEAAIKAGLKAILASPNFFYLAHPRSEDGTTDLFAVASRLFVFPLVLDAGRPVARSRRQRETGRPRGGATPGGAHAERPEGAGVHRTFHRHVAAPEQARFHAAGPAQLQGLLHP
ncbi:MAG: DUF1587 domain-containing protein [Verrucomicrobiae bacterium]|nr:DUF1587 domain-containing protein [Verrucomicrobiae bacterium]